MRNLCLGCICVLLLASCKGGGNGVFGNKTISSPVVNGEIPPAQVEVQEIKSALAANPNYQLSQSEIQTLDESKVLTAEEKELLTQLQVNQ